MSAVAANSGSDKVKEAYLKVVEAKVKDKKYDFIKVKTRKKIAPAALKKYEVKV